ncbi:MAG TPA: phage virion morphogenesis protein [Lentimicrobium sp.]|nr:phage virion morphogenesis protein [Bacteroidales bacterium]HLO92430.1 phage virion morphogenesis protein [Lentimicrobium sp.]
MARNFKLFAGDIRRKQKEIAEYIANDAPRHVGKIAVDHFKLGFDNEGFTDATLKRWKEVKRRQPPVRKGVAGKRKILQGDTGDLFSSIEFRPERRRTVIFSDKVYAQVHNEGLMAGRKGHQFQMPKRQFMGPSMVLDENIQKRFNRDIKRIMNKI